MLSRVFSFCLLIPLLVACTILAGEPAKGSKSDALSQAFNKLKALSGTWEAIKGPKDVIKSKVTYRTTAAGSAVIETIFVGTKMEMVSVYHRDGKRLVMTHYCMAQNQPRFTGRVDKKTGDLILNFAGGTNLNPKKDMHVRSGRIHFIDNDNVSSEWEFWTGGKSSGSHKMTLRRVK